MGKTTVYVEKIKVEVVNQTCSACPSQWDALTDRGSEIYVRYRWGYLEVSWGVMGETIYGEQMGDEFDGFITYEELIARTEHIIEWPETCGNEPGPLYIVDFNTGKSTTIENVDDVKRFLVEGLDDDNGTDTGDN